MNAEVIALLEQIREGQYLLVAEFRALREVLETSRRQEVEPQPDAPTADLLRVIRAAVGDRVFSSADLEAHASLPDAADLRAAIVAAVGSTNARRIGKALRAIEGRNVAGLTVHRVGEDRAGAIWLVAGVRRE